MGNFAFNFLKKIWMIFTKVNFINQAIKPGPVKVLSAVVGNRTRKLVKIPHLSRYDITSHRSVIDKIKTIRDLKLIIRNTWFWDDRLSTLGRLRTAS